MKGGKWKGGKVGEGKKGERGEMEGNVWVGEG